MTKFEIIWIILVIVEVLWDAFNYKIKQDIKENIGICVGIIGIFLAFTALHRYMPLIISYTFFWPLIWIAVRSRNAWGEYEKKEMKKDDWCVLSFEMGAMTIALWLWEY